MATCQICARTIKDKSGVIAHHGYKRPFAGWQTGSCFGARYQSWELACDALPKAIQSAETYAANSRARADDLMVNPPETFDTSRRDAYGRVVRRSVAVRPDGFIPAKVVSRGSYMPDSYELAFSRAYRNHLQNAVSADKDVEFLTLRLSEWKLP